MPKKSKSTVVSALVDLDCAVSPSYENQNRAFGDFNLPFLNSLISQYKVRRVLDVGCGEGSFILQLAKLTPKVIYDAVEIIAPLLHMAKSRQGKNNRNVNFINEAFGNKFSGKDYGLILARFAVEHMTDVDGFLRAAKKRLLRRGKIAITEYYVTTDGITDPFWLEFRKREFMVYKKVNSHAKSSLWLPQAMARAGFKEIYSTLHHVSPVTIGAENFFDLVRVYATTYSQLDRRNWSPDFVKKVFNWCAREQKNPTCDPTMWVSHTVGEN